MIPLIRDLFGEFMQAATRIPMNSWSYIFIAVLLTGFVCLRGYGSRSNY